MSKLKEDKQPHIAAVVENAIARMSSKEDDYVRHEPLVILLLLIILELPLLIHGMQKSVQTRQFSMDGDSIVAVPMYKLHELKKRVSQVSKQYLHTNIIHTKNNLCNCKCTVLPSYFNLTFSNNLLYMYEL